MKHKLSLLTTAAVITAASQAGAQGYLSIGRNADQEFERKQPLIWTVGAQVGYDSNVNVSSTNEEDSSYISGHLGVTYLTGDGRRTALNFNANYSPLYYWDAPPGVDDFQHNWRVGLDFRKRINPRLTITDSFYVSYEVEPDYSIGATVARRTDPYWYGHNSLAAAYAWTRRFSTVTSWTVSGVDYDGPGADYFTNMFANEFRYAFSRTTTGTFTLRYAMTDSDLAGSDYDSFYVLVGADHRFSPRLTGSIRAGAEFRDADIGGNDSTPYVETALSYMVKRKTSLRWYAVFGFPTDGTQGDADIRTGLTATHRFDSRLSGNVGLHYIGEDMGPAGDQDTLALSAGLDYVLFKNVSVNGGYSFTTSDSSAFGGAGDFDRHMFQVGISSRW
jgi:hypothetical protein